MTIFLWFSDAKIPSPLLALDGAKRGAKLAPGVCDGWEPFNPAWVPLSFL